MAWVSGCVLSAVRARPPSRATPDDVGGLHVLHGVCGDGELAWKT